MTNERAEQVANVLLTAAAAGVVVYVARTPPLRRLAWRLAVTMTLLSTANPDLPIPAPIGSSTCCQGQDLSQP